MNKLKLFIVLLLVSMSANAVVIKNVSAENIQVGSYSGKIWGYILSGQTWEKKGITQLAVRYEPKESQRDCQSFESKSFSGLDDDTTINFNCEESTITKN